MRHTFDRWTMGTVLIVEDEPVDRFIAEEIIARCGEEWRVKSFPDANKALNFLSFYTAHGGALPEIILLDLMMPLTDGLEFLRNFHTTFHKHSRKSHLVVLTISESREQHKKAISLGATAVITKPLTPEKWTAIRELAG